MGVTEFVDKVLSEAGRLLLRLRPWGVTLALVEHGRVVVGGIHEPAAGTTVLAEHGSGAWRNGQRLTVGPAPVATPAIGLSASAPPLREKARALLDAVWNHGAEIRMYGCGTAALAAVACGTLSAFVEIDGGPWDYAAGALAVREAGGAATTLTGADVDHTGVSGSVFYPPLVGLVADTVGLKVGMLGAVAMVVPILVSVWMVQRKARLVDVVVPQP